jgi:hypothetical protein
MLQNTAWWLWWVWSLPIVGIILCAVVMRYIERRVARAKRQEEEKLRADGLSEWQIFERRHREFLHDLGLDEEVDSSR